jgi:hypothetical protein
MNQLPAALCLVEIFFVFAPEVPEKQGKTDKL